MPALLSVLITFLNQLLNLLQELLIELHKLRLELVYESRKTQTKL